MAGQVNIGGVWKNIAGVYVNIGGTWKTASSMRCNIGGVWKDGWSSSPDSYTKSLLHFDGTDGSTVITDEIGKTWAAYGNAQIDTAQKKFGTASLLLDGTGDYISTADSADWDLGTGDFTIDCWIRLNSLPSDGSVFVIASQYQDAGNYWRVTYYNSSGTYRLQLRVVSGASTLINMTQVASLSAGTWYHLAVVRNGNNFKIFLDGTQLGSDTAASITMPNLSSSLYIGSTDGSTQFFDGWIDEFRFSKGIARWTSNFTPPAFPY